MVNKFDILEFSKIYKRFMDIELCLKACFSNALGITAPSKRFYRLIPYFNSSSFDFSKYNFKKIKEIKK